MAHSFIAGGMIQLEGTLTDPFTAHLPIQLAAALIGTASFAIIFGSPRRYCLQAGAVGMFGWLAYLLSVRYTPLGVVGATFIAATIIAILSRRCAIWFKCPSTVFLICGIFPLIPGAGVFWSSYFIVSGQMRASLTTGLTAIGVTIAIVFGIIIAANLKIASKRKSTLSCPK